MENTISNLKENQFDDFLKQSGVVVVIFGASWCQPCVALEESMRLVAQKYPEVHFGHVDVEQEDKLKDDFEIRTVPTIMVFRQHIALLKESGQMTQPVIENLIEQAQSLDMEAVKAKIARKMVDEE